LPAQSALKLRGRNREDQRHAQYQELNTRVECEEVGGGADVAIARRREQPVVCERPKEVTQGQPAQEERRCIDGRMTPRAE
jgi:hypothetical protein